MSDIMEEDQLLLQIDQFRDKAMQLTKLINNRERRVKELEALVRAKEEKNKELQITLQKKQEEADSLVLDVNNKVDNIMEQVKATMGNLEQKIVDQASSSEEKVQEQQAAVKETMDSMTAGLGTIKDELSEKVHSENVKVYRNIQDLLKEMNNGVEMSWDEIVKVAQSHVHAQCQHLADYKRVRKVVVSKEPLERTSIQKVRRVAYKGKLDECN